MLGWLRVCTGNGVLGSTYWHVLLCWVVRVPVLRQRLDCTPILISVVLASMSWSYTDNEVCARVGGVIHLLYCARRWRYDGICVVRTGYFVQKQ